MKMNNILIFISLTLLSHSILCFEILPHREHQSAIFTTFTVNYPDTNISSNWNITLRGDNCNLTWSKGVPMKKMGKDTWSTALLCPIDTKISCKVLINDHDWMMGANHVFTVSGSSSANTTIYPSFNPKINSIVDTSPISSQYLNYPRKLSIYYPPSFYDNTYKKYEIVLMHDGQNLFDASKSAFGAWYCQNTTNLLIGQGKIREIIIVGIWNTPERNTQYTYSYDPQEKFGGKGDKYLDFIEKQLLPRLRNNELKGRIDQQKGITIGGSSLGGLISCYATITRPSVFPNSICMSSSFWWNNQDFLNTILPSKQYSPSTKIYMDSGDSGPSQDSKNQTLRVYNNLKQKGYKQNNNIFYYLDKGGQHSESYWGKRFYIPLIDLFAP